MKPALAGSSPTFTFEERSAAGRLRTRLRAALAGPPSWLIVALLGGVLGYALVAKTPLLILAPLVLVLLVVSLWKPRMLALIALAISPLGTIAVAMLPGVDFRFSMMTWWLPAAALLAMSLFAKRTLIVSKATLALTVYALFLFSSALWSAKPAVALKEGLQFFTFVWIFLVFDNLFQTPRQLQNGALIFLGMSTLVVGGSAFSASVTPILPELRMGKVFALRFVDAYYHPVTIAALASSVVLMATSLLLGARLSTARRVRLCVSLVTGLLLCAAILKRSATAGLMGGGLLMLSFYGWRRTGLFAVVSALIVTAVAVSFPDVRGRFADAADPMASRSHYAMPYVGWIMFKEQPLLGHGVGSFSYSAAPIVARMHILDIHHVSPDELKEPHNIVAKIASESGIGGLVLFGVFLGIVLWTTFRACRGSGWPLPNVQAVCRGFLGASIVQLTVTLFENVDNHVIFWIILAMGYRGARMIEEYRRPLAEARVPARRTWPQPARPVVQRTR
jgi:O-antigen ligase